MLRIFDIFKDRRIHSIVGLVLALVALYLISSSLHVTPGWTTLLLTAATTACVVYWIYQWKRVRRASSAMDAMFQKQVESAAHTAPENKRQEIELLRNRLLDAVQTIKKSKLGQTTGNAALYEMPWYIVIGNPAAGKSTAVINSGLNFPFSDKGGQAVQGIGGTRNCDWFFTTEGILLDTAGRYAVHEEDRSEWFGFLELLRKYRPKAPINGIVIVASIAELTANRPESTIKLAKQLRQRVQELTERLELFVPVYVMFSKVDLIAGFVDFFEDSDAAERGRVWGATLPYEADGQTNAIAAFDRHFDALAEGIKELGTARMALNRGQAMSPGILTFPIEFVAVKQHLRTFIATLFEENPFQFKPIFRGFYFTSAVQEGVATHATGQRIVQQYGLSTGRKMTSSISSHTGFFLKNLFSSVIFADRHLVRQYANRRKLLLRGVIFYGGVLLLGLLLAGWSWSFVSNRHYVANVEADLDKVVKIQDAQVDLVSRLDALIVLQDRIEQLQRYRNDKPLALGFGLFQGDRIESKLRAEYFLGLGQVMLTPVAANLEKFLKEVNASAEQIQSIARRPQATAPVHRDKAQPTSASPYKDASASDPEDAYNALKAYLMLGNRDRVDSAHLGDQITRFWRTWLDANRGNAPREQIIRHAEKILTFYLSQTREPDFPLIDNKLALVDQVRATLRTAVKGTPARERVYGEIRMRASTRFPAITVAGIVGERDRDLIMGSHAIPGAFSRDAWQQFVQGAIKEASYRELQSADWVLKTTIHDDLSLEGSPEQIQHDLVRMYKEDYVREWKKFMQGISIKEFDTFDKAVTSMTRLGDPISSPLRRLMQTLYDQTSWDNPSLADVGMQGARSGILDWFRTVVLRQSPSRVNVNLNLADSRNSTPQTGMIGKEFSAISRLAAIRNEKNDTSLMTTYLEQLSKLRTRFNQIKNAGDIGPASRLLMQATLDGSNSELADALKYVDESMLAGMPDDERTTVRPLLVRPLIQAFTVIVPPTEQELNRTWSAQVYEPFQRTLATKYPFATDARVEATTAEISRIFGAEGAISTFVQNAMGPLVVRRGDTLSARTWADIGLHLNPEFSSNLARYVSTPAVSGETTASKGRTQTTFQLQPTPTPGLVEFTIEIDGQQLRYRNGQQSWTSFVWPSTQGQPGARISAVAADGQAFDIVNFPGQFGLEKLISSAQRKKLDDGSFVMTWTGSSGSVTANFRLVSDATGGAGTSGANGGLRGMTLPATVAGTPR